jgi:hypothetical protein
MISPGLIPARAAGPPAQHLTYQHARAWRDAKTRRQFLL